MLNQDQFTLRLANQSMLWKDQLRNRLLNIATTLAIPKDQRQGFTGYSIQGLSSDTAEADRSFIKRYKGPSDLIEVDLVKELNSKMTKLNNKYLRVKDSLRYQPKDISKELQVMNTLRADIEASAGKVFTSVKSAIEKRFKAAKGTITEPVKAVSAAIESIEQSIKKNKNISSEEVMKNIQRRQFNRLQNDANGFISKLSRGLNNWYSESQKAYRQLLRSSK